MTLRSACRRSRTFLWMVLTLMGLCCRSGKAAVTSYIRVIGFGGQAYHRFLHLFHGMGLEPMRKVARMLRNHEELLMNRFRAKGELSSGAVEGLNNKIRVISRRSYGFRICKAMKIALCHALGRLPEPEAAHRFC